MTTKTTLTATLPNGETIARKTARTYTHVVVGYKPNARIAADARKSANHYREEAARYEAMAKAVEDNGYEVTENLGYGEKFVPLASVPALAKLETSRNVARTTIVWSPEKCRTWAAQAIEVAERNEARAEAAKAATENLEDWCVVGWCGRPDLADKLASTHNKSGLVMQIISVND